MVGYVVSCVMTGSDGTAAVKTLSMNLSDIFLIVGDDSLEK